MTNFLVRFLKARVYGHIQGTVQIFFGNDFEEPLEFDPTTRVAAQELNQAGAN